ncbi:hypothetical protein [Paracoccus marcusii]|uniref:hypothetical protein n=1 Tax=Paracoccus marcusii TaxID=59779 RepID=UPI0035A6DD0C
MKLACHLAAAVGKDILGSGITSCLAAEPNGQSTVRKTVGFLAIPVPGSTRTLGHKKTRCGNQ